MSIKVNTNIMRPPKMIIEGFRSLLERGVSITPAVSDAMNRTNAMSSDIKPLFEGIRFVGVAITVKTIASDIAPVIRALDVIEPGDVIVVDTHNSKDTAFWGEMVSLEAQRKGAEGVILDSAVRDVVEIRKFGFPVLSQGVTPNVAVVAGFGYVNVPIQCGGVSVSPGDIIVVDECGVAVVPREEAEDILQECTQYLENEVKVANKITAGINLSEILGLHKLEENVIDIMAQYGKESESENA